AVLPRLAPVDGGQSNEKRSFRKERGDGIPGSGSHVAAHLERVLARSVVIDGGPLANAVDGTAQEIALGRVEVAARRVDAQGPARPTELLPRRQREGVV